LTKIGKVASHHLWKDVDKRKIEEIILVDVGSTKRLGTFANLVEGKRVVVFDHHPGTIDVFKACRGRQSGCSGQRRHTYFSRKISIRKNISSNGE